VREGPQGRRLPVDFFSQGGCLAGLGESTSNYHLLVLINLIQGELNLRGWLCQLNWSFVQIFGNAVSEIAKQSPEKMNPFDAKMKLIPKKSTFDEKLHESSTSRDS
jgi:hypothetical protein